MFAALVKRYSANYYCWRRAYYERRERLRSGRVTVLPTILEQDEEEARYVLISPFHPSTVDVDGDI